MSLRHPVTQLPSLLSDDLVPKSGNVFVPSDVSRATTEHGCLSWMKRPSLYGPPSVGIRLLDWLADIDKGFSGGI